jgi:hypothetical protein
LSEADGGGFIRIKKLRLIVVDDLNKPVGIVDKDLRAGIYASAILRRTIILGLCPSCVYSGE